MFRKLVMFMLAYVIVGLLWRFAMSYIVTFRLIRKYGAEAVLTEIDLMKEDLPSGEDCFAERNPGTEIMTLLCWPLEVNADVAAAEFELAERLENAVKKEKEN